MIPLYDNEWGYSNQCINLLQYVARKDAKFAAKALKNQKQEDVKTGTPVVESQDKRNNEKKK